MTDSSREALITHFLEQAGWADAQRSKLAGDASFRRYDRLEGPKGRAVLMDAPPPEEDIRPFVRVARHLTSLGLGAPRILATDAETGFLLLEDLGDAIFTRVLCEGAGQCGRARIADFILTKVNFSQSGVPREGPDQRSRALIADIVI